MGDDGVGPVVARALAAEYEFAPDVTVVDSANRGIDLMPYVADADVAILIDTACGKHAPGVIERCSKEQLFQCARDDRLCPHNADVRRALVELERSGRGPRAVMLVAVVPQWIATGPNLSEAVRLAVPAVVEQIVDELCRLGIHPRRRVEAREPETWWERQRRSSQNNHAAEQR
jgi:hydrogenase maturation protease